MQKHRALWKGPGEREYLRGGLASRVGRRVTYLFRDQFVTADDSPVTSPRTAEPGPGTLTVTELDGTWAVAGDKLAFTAQGTPSTADLSARVTSSVDRLAGRAVAATLNLSSAAGVSAYVGWWNSTTLSNSPRSGLRLSGTTLQKRSAGNALAIGAIGTGTDYGLLVVLKSASDGGSWLFVKGGAFGSSYKLLFHDFADTTSPLYAGVANESGAGTFDDLRVIDRVGPPAALVEISGSAAGIHAGASDLFLDVSMKAASPLGGGLAAVAYRVQDGSNYWQVIQDLTGALKLDECNGGTTINRRSEAGVWTAGSTRWVSIRAMGTKHGVWHRANKTDAQPSMVAGGEYDSVSATPFDSASTIQVTALGGASMTNLVAYRTDWPELNHV